MKILVIKLSSLGDIVHTIPAVNLIKNSIPDVHIDWLCYKKFSALLNTQYSINETISLEDKQLSSTFDIVNKLKAFKYDYVLDFQGLIKTAFMASQISGQSVGFKKPRETWLQDCISINLMLVRYLITQLISLIKIFLLYLSS